MQEPVYEVVWPLGKLVSTPVELKPRPADLSTITICELSDYGFRSEEILPQLRELMKERFPGIEFVPYTTFGNTHGPEEAEMIENLGRDLKAHGCGAVISGVGG